MVLGLIVQWPLASTVRSWVVGPRSTNLSLALLPSASRISSVRLASVSEVSLWPLLSSSVPWKAVRVITACCSMRSRTSAQTAPLAAVPSLLSVMPVLALPVVGPQPTREVLMATGVEYGEPGPPDGPPQPHPPPPPGPPPPGPALPPPRPRSSEHRQARMSDQLLRMPPATPAGPATTPPAMALHAEVRMAVWQSVSGLLPVLAS